MGLLNTFFYAPDDAAALELSAPLGGPAGFDTRGLTEVPLATLEAILTQGDASAIIREPSHYVGEREEQWLLKVRSELVAALANLDEEAAGPVAEAWSQTEELAGTLPPDPADLAEMIVELSALARFSNPEQQLYLWISL